MTCHFRSIRQIIVLSALTLLFLFFIGALSPSHAAMSTVPVPVQTEVTKTSEHYTSEYYKVTTPADKDNTIYVEGRTKIPTKRFCIRLQKHNPGSDDTKYPVTVFVTPDENGEFSIKINTKKGNKKLPEIIDGKGTVAGAESYGTRPGRYGVAAMAEGTYHLLITRATTDAQADISTTAWSKAVLGGSNGYIYKEALLSVTAGNENNPKLIQYDDVISNNIAVREASTRSYKKYKDVYLKDFRFVLRNPSTEEYEMLTDSQVAYIQKVSDTVTAKAESNYEKLELIYEYVADHVYYDNYAFQKGKLQYANPYKNLYNLRNNITSANSKGGKVSTTCQGYSAMVIALTRTQDIPARLVYGHHITQPSKTWAQIAADQIRTRSHWWVEAYVDGRWVIIDANAGTRSKWIRTSFSDSGTWQYRGVTNYSHFDPTIEQLSNSYSYNGIYYYGYDKADVETTTGLQLKKNHEKKQLRAFLNTTYNGITNGKRLNDNYSAYTFSTWTNGTKSSLKVDNQGRVTRISWNKEQLYGTLDLSDFAKLEHLSVYSNKLSKIDLTNCSNLTYISAAYNKLTSFNCTASSKVTYLNLKGNKLTSVKFRYGKKQRVITVKTNTKKANFGIRYKASNKKKVTIYAKKIKGYKYLGIYNKTSGKRISKKLTYTFNPSGKTYYIKYKKIR